MKTVMTLAAAVLAVAVQTPADAADLNVEVAGAPAAPVYAALYDSADAWMKEGRALKTAVLPPGQGTTLVFTDLAPGRYAVSLFEDASGDGRLGVNAFGIPTERWGVSRDAIGRMGPPAFADAAVEVPATGSVKATLQ